MDQIGVVCQNIRDGFQLLSVIAGNDPKDGAMFPEASYEYKSTGKDIKIGVPASVIAKADENTQKSIYGLIGKFNSAVMDLEYFDVYKQAMYILASAEISGNMTRYDGVKFGYRSPHYKGVDDMYIRTRTEAFGLDTKLASIMGSMALSQAYYGPYYEKAMRIRRLIKEALRFDEYDVIILPTTISGSPYDNLSLFSLAPLAGLPSISFSYQGSGIQLIAGVRNENALLTAWEVAQA
jgi:aspartyl-tRNA(Asn)/glutamyl-tRNA(Gln) amidotransferase subunit A